MNSSTLNELFAYIDSWSDAIHGLCVMRHGVIVAEGYFGSDYHQYIQEDKPEGVHHPVMPHEKLDVGPKLFRIHVFKYFKFHGFSPSVFKKNT